MQQEIIPDYRLRRFPVEYLLVLYSNEDGWNQLTKEQQQQGYAAYMAYTEALKKAGALVGANRLQPSATATTVRVVDGKSQVLDGPYVDSKEQLGGYYLIEAPDLDSALAWAARCPGAGHGTVEVRPVWAMETNQTGAGPNAVRVTAKAS
jgi:hypothetical protein